MRSSWWNGKVAGRLAIGTSLQQGEYFAIVGNLLRVSYDVEFGRICI